MAIHRGNPRATVRQEDSGIRVFYCEMPGEAPYFASAVHCVRSYGKVWPMLCWADDEHKAYRLLAHPSCGVAKFDSADAAYDAAAVFAVREALTGGA